MHGDALKIAYNGHTRHGIHLYIPRPKTGEKGLYFASTGVFPSWSYIRAYGKHVKSTPKADMHVDASKTCYNGQCLRGIYLYTPCHKNGKMGLYFVSTGMLSARAYHARIARACAYTGQLAYANQ